jgi:imidazolonepropionase-like amidohydrolase
MFGLDWLDDDALAETVRPRDRSSVVEVIRGAQQRNSDTFRRTTYEALEQNLRLYEQSGVTWVLSGDTGVISTFPGFAEHRELEAIVAAGIDALRAISAATGDTAEFLHLPDRGTLTPGKRADFIVLDSDPIANISNTRKIRSVYLHGTQLDRKRMSAEFVG